MKPTPLILIVCTLFLSCNYLKSEPPKHPIARVNNDFLFWDDIKNLVPKGSSASDSILLTNDHIDRWARQKLLMQGALVNLSEKKQNEFNLLVSQYKSDLYTKAYLERLIQKKIDTAVSPQEAQAFYDANKASYKLNDNLLQFRYVRITQNSNDLDTIKKRFTRFNRQDKVYLDSIAVQFNSYFLNDSTWVKLSDVISKIPILQNSNKNQLLKKSNFLQLKDSLNLYLITINDFLHPGNDAPLSYIYSSIKKIIINKRKLALIKQLEKDIINDAIKNNQYQTYN